MYQSACRPQISSVCAFDRRSVTDVDHFYRPCVPQTFVQENNKYHKFGFLFIFGGNVTVVVFEDNNGQI